MEEEAASTSCLAQLDSVMVILVDLATYPVRRRCSIWRYNIFAQRLVWMMMCRSVCSCSHAVLKVGDIDLTHDWRITGIHGLTADSIQELMVPLKMTKDNT